MLLFLPNTPLWPRLLFAVLAAGRQPLLVDPRSPLEELEALLTARPPSLIVTIDIGRVLDKLLRLLPLVPQAEVRVARFAAELPFPRNLLFPLLRGGGLANLPNDPRFSRLDEGVAVAPAGWSEASLIWSGALTLPSGEISQEDLAADSAQLKAKIKAKERWLLAAPFASQAGLTCLLTALETGQTLVVTPRLDQASLDKLERNGRIDRRID